MDTTFNYEQVDMIVGRIMSVEDTTLGSEKQGYIVRYRGRIRMEDTAAAYDLLSEQLKPRDLTPLFRWDGDRHSVLLVKGIPKIKQSDPRINLVLGILTIASVLFTGAAYVGVNLPSDIGQAALAVIERGWPFAVSILSILGAHEFGHYLMGRYHGVHLTLPYFIPMPFLLFGTMGAFINMKEPPKNRRILLDIGIAGPLAGLVVAIPVLILGLYLSSLSRLNPGPNEAIQLEGNSIIYLASKLLVFGKLLPEPSTYAGVSPVLYWLKYFFTGQPLPFGGMDVNLSPVAWAGWGGLLVTAMNLVPAGQLDGGHMLYVLLGKERAQKTFPIILGALLVLSLVYTGWLIWAFIIFMFGRVYAEPLDQVTPLDSKRKWLAVLALILFILTFTPVPLGLMARG
jgi:membrane-associated protease RseP (regulator of RpoE activity)